MGVERHGGKEVLGDGPIGEAADREQRLAGECHVGAAAGRGADRVPAVQHGPIEVAVLLAERVVLRHVGEGLRRLHHGYVLVDDELLVLHFVEVREHGLQDLGPADHVAVEDEDEVAVGALVHQRVVDVPCLCVVRHAGDLLARDVAQRGLGPAHVRADLGNQRAHRCATGFG